MKRISKTAVFLSIKFHALNGGDLSCKLFENKHDKMHRPVFTKVRVDLMRTANGEIIADASFLLRTFVNFISFIPFFSYHFERKISNQIKPKYTKTTFDSHPQFL